MFFVSVLGEIAEFVHHVAELFKSSPPEAVAVVILGSIGLGCGIHWLIARRQAEPTGRNGANGGNEKLRELESKLESYSRVVSELEKDEADLWRLHPPKPPAHLAERLKASRTKIILVGHLKGGVGKTTLLTNLAAYFDGKGKKILAIDFDYQGSLTATLIRAVGKDISGPFSDIVFSDAVTAEDLITGAESLHPLLPRTYLIPAAYSLTQKENHALIRWLLTGGQRDVRFRLAELLLSQKVQERYDLVLIDIGPRLTTASVCAIASATHVLIPTILDQLSAEAVGSFLDQVQRLSKEMNTGLSAVSVIGTMTRQQNLSDANMDAIATIETALAKWPGEALMLQRNIPFKQSFIDCAGTGVAMLDDPGNVGPLIEALGAEVSGRIGL